MLPYSRAMIRAIVVLPVPGISGEDDMETGVDLGETRLTSLRVDQLDCDQAPNGSLDRHQTDERVELGEDGFGRLFGVTAGAGRGPMVHVG